MWHNAFRFFPTAPIVDYVGNMSSEHATASALDVKPLRYVARQPIIDREQNVFDYELRSATGSKIVSRGIWMKRRGRL